MPGLNLELIESPKHASRDVAHEWKHAFWPGKFWSNGCSHSNWKFFATEKASRVHMAQGSPGQDG